MKLLDEEVKSILTKLLEGQEKLTIEVRKNSIKLESIEKKIDIIAEVQTAHKEQNVRGFQDISNSIKDKDSLISSVVKDTSKDVKDLKDKFDKVEKVTIQNTYDVAYLKATK
ncbi:hypothetical protein [Clostridium sp.]|uniref:hypothetical protein n=1 Tax=Clostridium sp. TaxID=1506 RepID=UPI00359F8906